MPARIILISLLCFAVAMSASVGRTAARASVAASARPHHVRPVPRRNRLPSNIVDRRRTDDRAKRGTHREAQTAVASQPAPSCQGLSGRTLAVSTDKPVHIGLKTYPQTLDLRDHEVVLTFDDGPSPTTTPAVLDALRQACVKATFFLIGRNAAANPGLVRRELAEGHTLGHHSMKHPPVTLRGLDEHAGEAEIGSGIAADEQAAYGVASAGAPRVPFFRFPGFADTKHLLDYLDGRHVAVFGTDLWAADWLPLSPDFERKRVIDLLERSPRHAGIVLFHDTKLATARMLPAFLRDLRDRGYTVVDVIPATQGGEPAALIEAPKNWSSETEAIIARVWPSIAPGAHRHAGRRQSRASRLAGLSRGHRRARTAARSGSRGT